MLQIGARAYERALALRHLFAIDGEETVDVNLFWQVVSGRLQHSRPEQCVEICNVLTNEVVDFAIGGTPPIIELLAPALAPLLRRCHVADRRIKPYVPIVTGTVRDFETE